MRSKKGGAMGINEKQNKLIKKIKKKKCYTNNLGDENYGKQYNES